MINLKSNPFFLSDEDIQWVQSSLAALDIKGKVGQLFCHAGSTKEPEELKEYLNALQPGGIMYRAGAGAEIRDAHSFLQANSTIPLLIAANLEAGGNGIATEGTFFGRNLEVAASDDEEMAYRLGLVSAREGAAVGVNWAFAPVVDIDMNFRNPITNTRTFGSEPQRVLRMGKAYMNALQSEGLAASIKHFPGDGVDERDQHLHMTVNSLSVEEWNRTFGWVYTQLIEAGAKSLMVGHISLPAYSRMLVPGIQDKEIMPATLAPELIQTLLRKQLGYNGLIITDSTNMGGFTMLEKREIAVPKAIASGCDMFLFNINQKEDFEFMLNGIRTGILSIERLNEAVTRILALKASLGLHRKQKEHTLVPGVEALSVLKCEEHENWARECANASVTLVKDTSGLLPLNIKSHKRILLYTLTGDPGEYGNQQMQNHFKEKLEGRGFQVDIVDAAKRDLTPEQVSVRYYKETYDIVIYYANVATASKLTVTRLNWSHSPGIDIPSLIQELPTLFVSTANPYHLQDVPHIQTFINGYSNSEYVLDAIMDKLLGRSPFRGINPVDPFCNCWLTRL